jgi:hypothetical protein
MTGEKGTVNAETRRVIEQAVLAEYEKVVAGGDRYPARKGNIHTPP